MSRAPYLFLVVALLGCSGTKVVDGDGDGEDDGGSGDDGGSNGALSGLGSNSPSDLCARLCDCTGCSEVEEDECNDEVEDQLRQAEDEGCSGEADAYLGCLDDELECRDAEIDLDGCERVAEELDDCLN